MSIKTSFSLTTEITLNITNKYEYVDAKAYFSLTSSGISVQLAISEERTNCSGPFILEESDIVCFDKNNNLSYINCEVSNDNLDASISPTFLYGKLKANGQLVTFPHMKYRNFNKIQRYIIGFDNINDLIDCKIFMLSPDFGLIVNKQKYCGWYMSNPLRYLCDLENLYDQAFNDVTDYDYDVLECFIQTYSDNRYFELDGDNEKLANELLDNMTKLTQKIENAAIRSIFLKAANDYYKWNIT